MFSLAFVALTAGTPFFSHAGKDVVTSSEERAVNMAVTGLTAADIAMYLTTLLLRILSRSSRVLRQRF